MTEESAIEQIKLQCSSADHEMNGCKLDQIIQDFLRDNGFIKLADAILNVGYWRA